VVVLEDGFVFLKEEGAELGVEVGLGGELEGEEGVLVVLATDHRHYLTQRLMLLQLRYYDFK